MFPKTAILEAARADHIPAGSSGLWFVHKRHFPEPFLGVRGNAFTVVPAGTVTYLYRTTEATLHHDPPGEVVMEDTAEELKKHLEFIRRAYGSVLVTGLGLGCVVRGLLANPRVQNVTCLEKSSDVLRLVAPFMPEDRLTIIEADALSWTPYRSRFDCAWHDIWTDTERGEPHLDISHLRLFQRWKNRVAFQGAWSFDRNMKNLLRRHGWQLL